MIKYDIPTICICICLCYDKHKSKLLKVECVVLDWVRKLEKKKLNGRLSRIVQVRPT